MARFLVPATSANLGPGFDSFGLALSLHNRFEAEISEQWHVAVEGEGADHLRTDSGNVVAQGMARAFAEAGVGHLCARVKCQNSVPTGGGLGSSSTAIVGGLLLGEALTHSDFGGAKLLEMATEIEGHPDNVAAALFGGFTVCWTDGGKVSHARFEPARGLAAVVVPARAGLATAAARALLPEAVPHADAAFNVAHAGLLAASIVAGRPELLNAALADRLHEPYRASAVTDLQQVHDILRAAGAAGVALSGAGPTVIGLVAGETDDEALALAQAVAEAANKDIAVLGTRHEPQALRIDRVGARAF